MENKFHSEREINDKELFDQIGENYIQKDIYLPSRIARKHRALRTLEASGIKQCYSILEFGCGAGFTAEYLEGFYSKYLGVDYSETLIEYAKKHNDRQNVNYIVENIKSFNPDKTYDVIIMIGVLHHIDGIEKAMKNIIHCLNPGGLLITNEPHKSNPIIKMARGIRKHLDSSYSPDQREFDHRELSQIYLEAGFEEVKLIPQGFISTIFAELMLRPQFITLEISRLSCWFDTLIEHLPVKVILRLSWNVITVGKKPLD